MRKVNLYCNCPSSKGHSFILWPSSRSALLKYLDDNDFIKSVNVDNYRLKDDVLILDIFSNYEDVTIVIETDTEDVNYFKVYFGANDVDIYNSLALLTIDIKSIKL